MNTPVSISNDLKLAAKSPKVYLTNFFSELKNQIDLECEAYLSRSDLQVDQQDRAIFQQLQLIHEVNYFEKKCLHLIYKLLKRKIKFSKFDFEIFF